MKTLASPDRLQWPPSRHQDVPPDAYGSVVAGTQEVRRAHERKAGDRALVMEQLPHFSTPAQVIHPDMLVRAPRNQQLARFETSGGHCQASHAPLMGRVRIYLQHPIVPCECKWGGDDSNEVGGRKHHSAVA
jgi:hypothetical protein